MADLTLNVETIDPDPCFLNKSARFRTNALKKDGTLWTTVTTVKLYLVQPDGTVLPAFTATVENATTGLYYVDATPTGDNLTIPKLTPSGYWHRYWEGTEGTVSAPWGLCKFRVADIG